MGRANYGKTGCASVGKVDRGTLVTAIAPTPVMLIVPTPARPMALSTATPVTPILAAAGVDGANSNETGSARAGELTTMPSTSIAPRPQFCDKVGDLNGNKLATPMAQPRVANGPKPSAQVRDPDSGNANVAALIAPASVTLMLRHR